MSSLVPGFIFPTAGLNRLYTPCQVGTSPADIRKTFKRERIEGTPWPGTIPAAGVYDVVNTPTKLILLNNKKTKKYSHLRGKSSMELERIPVPEPERHLTGVSHVNKNLHVECRNSRSPRYTPTPSSLEWPNHVNRPQSTFSNGSHVNPMHHKYCLGHSTDAGFSLDMTLAPSDRPRPRTCRSPPKSYRMLNLDDSGLSKGQRMYLWSIARVYNVDNLRQRNQQQYFNLLKGEMRKGGYNSGVVYQYARYLESPRKTRCGKDEKLQRALSAPPRNQGQRLPRHQKLIHQKKTKAQSSTEPTLTEQETAKSDQSEDGLESGAESDQSGSSLSIEKSDFVRREGNIRPKSRIGRPRTEKKPTSEPQDLLAEGNKIMNAQTNATGTEKTITTNSETEEKTSESTAAVFDCNDDPTENHKMSSRPSSSSSSSKKSVSSKTVLPIVDGDKTLRDPGVSPVVDSFTKQTSEDTPIEGTKSTEENGRDKNITDYKTENSDGKFYKGNGDTCIYEKLEDTLKISEDVDKENGLFKGKSSLEDYSSPPSISSDFEPVDPELLEY